jgi:alpha-galactosidase
MNTKTGSFRSWLWLALFWLAACGSGKHGSEPASGAGGAAGAGGASDAPEDVPIVADPYFPVPLAEGLAPTPPMGWSSWNAFQTNVTAERVQGIADAMVESGMKDAGYQYVNIDDGWALADRAEDGTVQVDTEAFPDGIAGLADYVHSLGLKLGIYSSRGAFTCARRAGSGGYEELDAETYAQWGVDYLKYDNCPSDDGADAATIQSQYQTMRDALERVDRPIVFSLCAWSFYEWGLETGQLWRTTSDIDDVWTPPAGSTKGSVTSNARLNRVLAAYAGPNSWNDPDMLEVGNGNLSDTEYRAHFSLWAIMAAPLIAGNDLSTMSKATRDILTNEEVIAVDQDALGLQGVQVRTDGLMEVWAKPLNESGARAVLLLNGAESAQDITVSFADIGLGPGDPSVRDLWAHEDLGTFSGGYTAESVPAHGAVLLKVQGNEPPVPSGSVYVSDLTWTYAANYQGPVERDMSNGATAAADGKTLTVGKKTYDKGLGVSAPSLVIVRLGKACTRFTATAGLDAEAQTSGSVALQVWADGKQLFESDVLRDTATATIDVDVSRKQRLMLKVTNGGDGTSWDRANWGNAKLECQD